MRQQSVGGGLAGIRLWGSGGRVLGGLFWLARLSICIGRIRSTCLVSASVGWYLLLDAIPAIGLVACRVSGRSLLLGAGL